MTSPSTRVQWMMLILAVTHTVGHSVSCKQALVCGPVAVMQVFGLLKFFLYESGATLNLSTLYDPLRWSFVV